MRITQNSMNRTQMMGLNDSLGRLQKTQEQLTSGKRLTRPSDNPLDSMAAMRFRAEQRQLEQHGVNIADGLSRMGSADAALMSSNPMLQRVRVLTLNGLNGVNSATERNAMAQEIKGIKGSLMQIANTQYLGRPVFAGTANVTNAFDPATGAFLGNTDAVMRDVSDAPGDSGRVDITVPGRSATGTGGAFSTLFQGAPVTVPGPPPVTTTPPGTLDAIVAALESGDHAALQTQLGELDKAMESMVKTQAAVGATMNQLQTLAARNGRLDDQAQIDLSNVEDVDFVKAAMDMQIQSNAYEAALSASAKIIQPSLAQFLR